MNCAVPNGQSWSCLNEIKCAKGNAMSDMLGFGMKAPHRFYVFHLPENATCAGFQYCAA